MQCIKHSLSDNAATAIPSLPATVIHSGQPISHYILTVSNMLDLKTEIWETPTPSQQISRVTWPGQRNLALYAAKC